MPQQGHSSVHAGGYRSFWVVEGTELSRLNGCGNPSDRLDAYIELDRQFHHELCAINRNAYVTRFYTVVNMHLSMSFSYGMGACNGIETTFREHEAIVNHLKAHSAEALTVLDAHLMHSRQNILNEPSFIALPD